jgi:hypothetical protein
MIFTIEQSTGCKAVLFGNDVAFSFSEMKINGTGLSFYIQNFLIGLVRRLACDSDMNCLDNVDSDDLFTGDPERFAAVKKAIFSEANDMQEHCTNIDSNQFPWIRLNHSSSNEFVITYQDYIICYGIKSHLLACILYQFLQLRFRVEFANYCNRKYRSFEIVDQFGRDGLEKFYDILQEEFLMNLMKYSKPSNHQDASFDINLTRTKGVEPTEQSS